MGTSVSHPSPKNTNWKRVLVCHENKSIPESRVMNEIWRASEKDAFADQIKSPIIFSCYEAVATSNNAQQAIQRFTGALLESKGNSIVAEFAKRAIPMAFQSKNRSEKWASNLFSQITNYIVSRDAGGFVGENYRNATVSSLVEYKKKILQKVDDVMAAQAQPIKTRRQWEKFVDDSISKLKSAE